MYRSLQIFLGALFGLAAVYGYLWLPTSEMYLFGDVSEITMMACVALIAAYLGPRLIFSVFGKCPYYYMSWPMAILALVCALLSASLSSLCPAAFMNISIIFPRGMGTHMVRSAFGLGFQVVWAGVMLMFLSIPYFARKWDMKSF